MTIRRLPYAAAAAGLVAAWGSARYPGCLTALSFGVMVAILAVAPDRRRLVSPGWVAVGLVALAASWAVALDHELALRHSLLVVLAVALLGLSRVAGADDRIVGALALGLAATAAVAVVQVLAPPPLSLETVREVAPELRTRALARLAVGRASGTAAVPGHFAALLVMAAPLLVAGWTRSRGRRRWGWLAALALVAVGVVLARSLAAVLLAAALAAVAAAVVRPPRARTVAAALAVVAVAAGTSLSRTDLAALEPVRLRWLNWRTAAAVFAERPLLGAGLGGIGQAALATPHGATNITPYTHNTPLGLAAELGLAGVALVVAGVVALARLLAAGRRDHLALTLAVAAVPLHNLVDFSAYMPEVLLPWAVLAGTLAARVRRAPARPLPGWVLLPVLGGALVLSALSWRAEVLHTRSHAEPAPGSVDLALAAARWAPWTVQPVESAAAAALVTADPRIVEIERELARRHWVRPVSAAWAETRARLLLASGRAGEALAWAREARRRAPWRGELETLEAACRARS